VRPVPLPRTQASALRHSHSGRFNARGQHTYREIVDLAPRVLGNRAVAGYDRYRLPVHCADRLAAVVRERARSFVERPIAGQILLLPTESPVEIRPDLRVSPRRTPEANFGDDALEVAAPRPPDRQRIATAGQDCTARLRVQHAIDQQHLFRGGGVVTQRDVIPDVGLKRCVANEGTVVERGKEPPIAN
jgi:hypothetical protein